MDTPVRGAALCASISAISFAVLVPGPGHSQTALPELQVTVTRPKAPPRPKPRPAPAPRRAAAPAPTPAPAAEPPPAQPEAPQPGTLPIVADRFATVTVVNRDELQRSSGGTLGDVLFSRPGITGSGFAPGASSRPIIRGLDANRVRVQENGIGANGASDLGEDHFVPVDPLSTNQVEVIRGPATLRYGSQAIGGVVESTNNRIPTTLPCRDDGTNRLGWPAGIKAPVSDQSRPCVNAETRGAVSTADQGLNGAVLLDAGSGNFAIHADAFGRTADDYRIPRYPYLTPPNPAEAPNATQPGAFNGRQPNSSVRTEGHSIGGSYVFNDGFIGLAVTQNNALYHIPGIDGENHRTRIDGHQTAISSRGEWRGPVEWIDAVRYWAGTTDYRHTELGLADPFNLTSDGARQIFTNREQEGRVEVQLAPRNLGFASLTTTVGTQGGYQQLTAPSPDDPGSPLNGLWDANHNWRVAGYVFSEFKFSESTKAQIAGRIESVSLSGTTPSSIPATFDINVDPASIGPATTRNPSFTPKSASVGVIQNLFWDLIGSVTAQYVERAPKPAELFSRGAHDATATFDIGNPNLRIEAAKSVEAGLRRTTGPFRFELTAYYTRFSGFIFRRLTGNTCDESACVDASDPNPLELRQAVYSQRDAIFRGAEFQSQYDVAPLWTGMFGIETQFDVVRATFTDGTNVPRIPPVRVGGGVFWRNDNWLARTSLLHAFPQNHIAIAGETPTPGYNDLRAEVSYRWKPRRLSADNLSEVAVGIVATNLLDDDIRNHVSYNKDEVLMPGRSVRVFANVKY